MLNPNAPSYFTLIDVNSTLPVLNTLMPRTSPERIQVNNSCFLVPASRSLANALVLNSFAGQKLIKILVEDPDHGVGLELASRLSEEMIRLIPSCGEMTAKLIQDDYCEPSEATGLASGIYMVAQSLVHIMEEGAYAQEEPYVRDGLLINLYDALRNFCSQSEVDCSSLIDEVKPGLDFTRKK